MKVLLIGQMPKELGGNYTTGIAKVVYELSKQKADGVENYMYATNLKAAYANRLCKYPNQYLGYSYLPFRMLFNILQHPIQTYRQWKIYKKETRVNPLRFELYKANFEKAIDIVKPDVIHLHGNGLAPLYFAKNRGNIPILLTCHGVFERDINPKSQQSRYADYLTGLNEETREQIIKYYCASPDKITIIPNGVDTSKFYYSPSDRKKIRDQYQVNDETKIFITVASIQERKGQLAFTKIIKEYKGDWQYWIIGDGPGKDELAQYIEQNDLQNNVKLLGYRNSEELYKYYSAADVYAHASTKEGQALCEIEAHTTGIRTIVNKLIAGTIADNVYDNPGEYFVMDFSDVNLSNLEKWISQENVRQSRKNLDWSLVYSQYTDLYKRIAK